MHILTICKNDWIDNLLMAEFTVNNHVNVSIRVTLFFADYKFQLCISIKPSSIYDNKQEVKFLAVDQIVKKQDKMIKFV